MILMATSLGQKLKQSSDKYVILKNLSKAKKGIGNGAWYNVIKRLNHMIGHLNNSFNNEAFQY